MKTRSRDRRRASGQKAVSKTAGTAVQVSKEESTGAEKNSPTVSKTHPLQPTIVETHSDQGHRQALSAAAFADSSVCSKQLPHQLTAGVMLSQELSQQGYSHSSSPAPSGRVMEANRQAQQCGSATVSPTHTPVPESVQDARYADHQGNGSPVQLTELVPSTVYKTYSPPSDNNHNLTAMYGYPSNSYGSVTKEAYPSDFHGKTGGVYGDEHYSEAYGDKAKVLPGTDQRFPASPSGYGYYPRDSHYQLHSTFTPNAGVCKTYNFLTAESGSEQSSPELAQGPFSASQAVTYSPPLPASSPHSSNCSPPARDTLLPDTATPVQHEGSPATATHGSFHSASSSAAPPSSYYSDEQSLEGDSIREIQQEILRADIERHIYENYSQNLTVYTPDEDSPAESENISPIGGSSGRKSSSGSKKRRRRMQTPVQRKAANMRERKRMCHLNAAFDNLKDRLPNVRNRKKLSRIQTLRAAIFYISLLAECVQSS